jgi:surface protein
MGSFRVGNEECIRLFNGLSSLKTLDLSNFDTSNEERMEGMFAGCSSLEELDLSNFDTSKVYDVHGMFQDCSKLVSVYVGLGWKDNRFSAWAVDMFTGCTSIVGQDGSVYDANCANDYKKAHYGPGGYLKFKGEQLPTDVSPIGAEKTVAFPTDGSLANTTVDDVYYNLTGDNGYDANEGCIVINESTTMTTGSDGGVRFSEFIGLKFMVNGKGVVDLDCQTYGRKRLYVMVGEGTEPKVYTEDPRGIVEVSYDVTEPTNIYVYAMDEAAAPRMVEAKSDCVKLWSLTVKPGATAIAPVTAAEQAAGEYYTLDGRKLTGRPATAGVYVTGGRKVVVK